MSANSIAVKFDIICDKKPYFLSCLFFGLLLGCFFNLIIKISWKKRALFLSIITFLLFLNSYYILKNSDDINII